MEHPISWHAWLVDGSDPAAPRLRFNLLAYGHSDPTLLVRKLVPYTVPGWRKGTPFRQPEIGYNLGVFLYQLLTGQFPWEEQHMDSDPRPSPRPLPLGTPDKLSEFIHLLLDSHPENRASAFDQWRLWLQTSPEDPVGSFTNQPFPAGSAAQPPQPGTVTPPSPTLDQPKPIPKPEPNSEDIPATREPNPAPKAKIVLWHVGIVFAGLLLVSCVFLYVMMQPSASSPVTKRKSKSLRYAPVVVTNFVAPRSSVPEAGTLPAKVTLIVDATPKAKVTLGTEFLGWTPLSRQLPASATSILLQIEADGYQTQRRSLTLDHLNRLHVVLEKLPAPLPSGPGASSVGP
jgi:serine/threonine protein kinase